MNTGYNSTPGRACIACDLCNECVWQCQPTPMHILLSIGTEYWYAFPYQYTQGELYCNWTNSPIVIGWTPHWPFYPLFQLVMGTMESTFYHLECAQETSRTREVIHWPQSIPDSKAQGAEIKWHYYRRICGRLFHKSPNISMWFVTIEICLLWYGKMICVVPFYALWKTFFGRNTTADGSSLL